jgi:penicillin-insensitive murein endopeptidase
MASMTANVLRLALAGLLCGAIAAPSVAQEEKTAKQLFGAQTLPNGGAANPIGFYAKGCMSGAVALPADGPTWQAMRLSRNRRWGNPAMISFLKGFSGDAEQLGWGNGILVGDISQPRGGPMITGHASHQIGLDADIWFTPKPAAPLTVAEREAMPFTSMLDKSKFLTVDPRRWSPTHAKLLMLAASYPQVERVFVNPAIKKKMCETWTGDRSLLGKLRPVYGHDEHFHIRLFCPPGAANCEKQAAVAKGDGCDKSLAWWFTKEPWAAPKPPDPTKKPVKPRPVMLTDLPKACAAVLAAPARPGMADALGANAANSPVVPQPSEPVMSGEDVPLPSPRPSR